LWIVIKDEKDAEVIEALRMSMLSTFSIESGQKACRAIFLSNNRYVVAEPSEPSGEILRKIKKMASSIVA
jgi:hypothetical protein